MPKATTRLPDGRQRRDADTDAQRTEYTTYAPPGEKCRKCRKPFKSLETCRRVAIERSSGGSALGPYEHTECPA
jgi:hypothetical protein